MNKDPYSVLGVSPDATDDEIKRAYHRLAKQYHPDLNPGDPEAARKMNEVNAAYEQIKNSARDGAPGQAAGAGGAESSWSRGPFDPGGFSGYDGEDPFGWQQRAGSPRARAPGRLILALLLGMLMLNFLSLSFRQGAVQQQSAPPPGYGQGQYPPDFRGFYDSGSQEREANPDGSGRQESDIPGTARPGDPAGQAPFPGYPQS